MNIHSAHEVLAVRDADIASSSFITAKLSDCTFNDVDLRRSTFTNVNLAGATFSDVNLSNVSIANANLTGMRIEGILVYELLKTHRERMSAAQQSDGGAAG